MRMNWSRAVQLVLVIAIASYLIYLIVRPVPKASSDDITENFEELEKELVQVSAKPEFKEDDIAPESTGEIKSMDTGALSKEDFELYGSIVEVYSRMLDRNPTPAEMFHYFEVMKKDHEFDLKKHLVLSEEYKIKEKAQTNMINHEAARTLNTQQVTNTIIDMYQRVTGRNPSSSTITFLREKYIEYEMDDTKLQNLVEKLEQKDGGAVADAGRRPTTKQSPKKEERRQETTDKADKPDKADKASDDANTDTTVTQGGGVTMILQRPNIYNIYNGDSDGKGATSTRFIGDRAGSVDPADLTAKILESAKQDCLDKDAPLKRNPTLLADFQGNRNMDELKYACERSTKYTNADDSGKLIPEFAWSVPQRRAPVCVGGANCETIPINQPQLSHGALLEEAKKTTVGSIMPEFEFREK
jgi:hypothetical protein